MTEANIEGALARVADDLSAATAAIRDEVERCAPAFGAGRDPAERLASHHEPPRSVSDPGPSSSPPTAPTESGKDGSTGADAQARLHDAEALVDSAEPRRIRTSRRQPRSTPPSADASHATTVDLLRRVDPNPRPSAGRRIERPKPPDETPTAPPSAPTASHLRPDRVA